MNVNKSKDELMADSREAGIGGRSKMNKDELADALQRHSTRETARARGDRPHRRERAAP